MIYGPYLASVEWSNGLIDCVMSDDDRLYFPCAVRRNDAIQSLDFAISSQIAFMIGTGASVSPYENFLCGIMDELNAGLPGVVD